MNVYTDSDVNLYAIAPTPFDQAGTVDTDALLRNITRIREDGVDGVLLTGSYGEFQSLTDQERIDICSAVTRRQICSSVMACAASPTTREAVDLTSRLFESGADQVMVSPPFAAELKQDDLIRHFETLADSAKGDLVIYNNPVFGRDLPPKLLSTIAEHERYAAIKQGTRSLPFMIETIRCIQSTGKAQILAASDILCAAPVGAGVYGVTSTNIWIFPRAFTALADPNIAPKSKELIMGALQPYANFVSNYGQPHTVKAAMTLRGYDGEAHVRHPYSPLGSVDTELLREEIERVDQALSAVTNKKGKTAENQYKKAPGVFKQID